VGYKTLTLCKCRCCCTLQVGVGGDHWTSHRWANVCQPHHWRMCLGPTTWSSHV